MKNLVLLILFILTIPNIILSQSKNEELLYSVEFSKENSKKFTFSKCKEGFIYRAYNKKKKEIQTCKWEVKLNKNKTEKLFTEIKNVLSNANYSSDNYLFKIKQNKDEIKLTFKNSSCTAEHKLYYLQKDCNRTFIIKLKKKEFKNIINTINLN